MALGREATWESELGLGAEATIVVIGSHMLVGEVLETLNRD